MNEPSSAPDFLDSIIILCVSAAVVVFLLWATSRTIGISAFENLPGWMQQSYNAIWTSLVSGTLGIGLAILKVRSQASHVSHPNYLFLIGIATVVMLILVYSLPITFGRDHAERNSTVLILGIACVVAGIAFFFRKSGTAGTMCLAAGIVFVFASGGQAVKRIHFGPGGLDIEFQSVQPDQVLPRRVLMQQQQSVVDQLSEQVSKQYETNSGEGRKLPRAAAARLISKLLGSASAHELIPVTPTGNTYDLGSVVKKSGSELQLVARGADVFKNLSAETSSVQPFHLDENGVVVDCKAYLAMANRYDLVKKADPEFFKRLEIQPNENFYVVNQLLSCQELTINKVAVGKDIILGVGLAKLGLVKEIGLVRDRPRPNTDGVATSCAPQHLHYRAPLRSLGFKNILSQGRRFEALGDSLIFEIQLRRLTCRSDRTDEVLRSPVCRTESPRLCERIL